MELYDHIIAETRARLSGMTARRWDYDETSAWRDMGASELVLLRDAAFELGGSGKPSANFTCVTTDERLVPRDEVLLCGRDLTELQGDVPFARLAFLLSDGIGDDEAAYQAIRDMEFVKYHVFPEGYMVRVSSESNREQVRVSRRALARGVSFRAVGAAYIRGFHKNPHVRRAQLIFVTDDGAAVAELARTAKKVDGVTRTLTRILEGIPADCGSCSLKPVCDEVEGMRELHFGMRRKEAAT